MSDIPTSLTLSIRNMVCDRCIRVVREELERGGYDVLHVTLGEAVVRPRADAVGREGVRALLQEAGFELLDDARAALVERISVAVIRYVRESERMREEAFAAPGSDGEPERLPQWIAREVGGEYAALSALYSQTLGVTIERALILQRIERVKELLAYGELTVSDIAWRLGYSSTAHLSAQFKNVTGETPTAWRAQRRLPRLPLDRVLPPQGD